MDEMPCFSSLFFRQRLNATVLPMLFGIALFLLMPTIWATVILLVCAAASLVVIFCREGESRSAFLCVLAGISLALLLMGVRGIECKNLERLCHKPCKAEGYVVEKGDKYCDLSLVCLDGNSFYKRVRVIGEADWNLGEKRCVTLLLYNPDPEDARSEGVDLLAVCRDEGKVQGKSFLYTLVGKVRESLLNRFSLQKNGGFLSAVLLGDRSGLTQAQTMAFRNTASSHILAISGLHISQTIVFLVCLFRLFSISRKGIRILLYPCVIVLYLLAGAGVSVFRASVMTLFSVTGLLLRRRSDSVTALCFSAFLLVLGNPYTLESPSFLLSYASTFGVVSCGVPLSEYMRNVFTEKEMHPIFRQLQALLLSLTMASVSFVFVLPVQLLLFGTAAPFAPLYAVILIPLFQVCLILSLFGAALTGLVFLPEKFVNFFLRIPAYFPDLVEYVSKGAPDLVEAGSQTALIAAFFLAALVVMYWKKAPMTGIFVLHGISILYLGVFSFLKIFLP